MARTRKPAGKKRSKQVEALSHAKTAARRNIPTAELSSAAERLEEMDPVAPVRYRRPHPLSAGVVRERDEDLDPQIIWNGARIRLSKAQVAELQATGEIEIGDAQLVWRGKDRQDWSDLVVNAPPLYIQDKVHPQAIIEDLVRRTREAREAEDDAPTFFKDHFKDFNGLDDPEKRTEFYQHSQHWSNRMILGDSLQVMASLAEREGLRAKVQCIYFDPPYGIKFNSNWQVSTQTRDVKDGKQTDISREPEQVKAFRDTWKDGIHSYLTYLRDRLTVARDLLHESGSIFVQIGDENVHRVRAVMDEVFGVNEFIAQIAFKKTGAFEAELLQRNFDYVLWFAKDRSNVKYRDLFNLESPTSEDTPFFDFCEEPSAVRRPLTADEKADPRRLPLGAALLARNPLASDGYSEALAYRVELEGVEYPIRGNQHWKTTFDGMTRLRKAHRLIRKGNTPRFVRYWSDNPCRPIGISWTNTGTGGFVGDDKVYVVQTDSRVIQRCSNCSPLCVGLTHSRDVVCTVGG